METNCRRVNVSNCVFSSFVSTCSPSSLPSNTSIFCSLAALLAEVGYLLFILQQVFTANNAGQAKGIIWSNKLVSVMMELGMWTLVCLNVEVNDDKHNGVGLLEIPEIFARQDKIPFGREPFDRGQAIL